MPWLNDVSSLVHIWYGGHKTGSAITDVVFGAVNSSGINFPRHNEDNPAFSTSEVKEAVPNTVTVSISGTASMRNARRTLTLNVDGAEVIQAYVSQQSPSINRPSKELKGFENVLLRPQQTETATIRILTKYATSFWDEHRNAWVQEAGRYIVQVGISSAENPLSADFEIG
ncbi:unnamed protein product [Penicillium discolor]